MQTKTISPIRKFLRERLRIFTETVEKEFYKILLGLFLAGVSLSILLRSIRDFLWSFGNTLIKSPPIMWPIGVWGILLILTFLLSSLLYELLKSPKSAFLFVDYLGYKWKAFDNCDIDPMPYCREHVAQIFEVDGNYFCPICHDELAKDLSNDELIRSMARGAKSLAEATIRKHLNLKPSKQRDN